MSIKSIAKGLLIGVAPIYMAKRRYKKKYGYKPNLKNPVTFNEKTLWIAIHYHNPLYTVCADKVKVRNYLEEKLGKDFAHTLFCKNYGVWNSVNQIDFNLLPESFVLKSNHASGQFILCNDKNALDVPSTKKLLKKWLKVNYYYVNGEWQYKNINPKIICEELLEDDIADYRIFCFEGKPTYIKVTKHNNNAPGGYDCAIFYPDWTEAEFTMAQNYGHLEISKPDNLETMLEIATKLSADFHFVRVDLYSVSGRTYFAELTFTPNSGCEKFANPETDLRFGNMFNLPDDEYVEV